MPGAGDDVAVPKCPKFKEYQFRPDVFCGDVEQYLHWPAFFVRQHTKVATLRFLRLSVKRNEMLSLDLCSGYQEILRFLQVMRASVQKHQIPELFDFLTKEVLTTFIGPDSLRGTGRSWLYFYAPISKVQR